MQLQGKDPPSSGLAKAARVTEIVANLVIICAIAATGCVWLGRNVAGHKSPVSTGPAAGSAPASGTAITLSGATWSDRSSTLVIAISSECPHCVIESPFYSEITKSPHRVPIFVVMPQEPATVQSFLDGHGIRPSKTFSTDLRNIDVRATPTIMLISAPGVVRKAWVGELSSEQKNEVVTALNHL